MTETEPTRPWYQHKVFIPAAAALVLLMVAVLVAMASGRPPAELTAAPATPEAGDPGQRMLADLAYVGVVSTDPASMVELGHKVCTAFDVGGSYWQIMTSLSAGGYTAEQASKVVAVSAADMCPRHTPVVDAALTPNVPAVLATPAVAVPATPPGTFGPGTYQVGSDIPPGNYRSTGPDGSDAVGCYYARLKHNDGAVGDIIDNDISKGQSLLTVKASDGYVSISGCSFAKR